MHNYMGTEWKLIASLRCGYSGVGAPSALETQQIIEWVRTGRIEMDFCVWTNKCVIFINIYIFHYGSLQKAFLSVLGMNSGIRESSAGWEGWEITAASLNTHPDPHSTSRNVQLKHGLNFHKKKSPNVMQVGREQPPTQTPTRPQTPLVSPSLIPCTLNTTTIQEKLQLCL